MTSRFLRNITCTKCKGNIADSGAGKNLRYVLITVREFTYIGDRASTGVACVDV